MGNERNQMHLQSRLLAPEVKTVRFVCRMRALYRFPQAPQTFETKRPRPPQKEARYHETTVETELSDGRSAMDA